MSINDSYDEYEISIAVSKALVDFYKALIDKINSLKINDIIKRKNPYLFKAKSMSSAPQIVDAVLAAFVSSSEETIFGNVFFEPIATIAAKGSKALAGGIDIMAERDDTIYAIAVKSGTCVFNSSSKQKQAMSFIAAQKLAQQARKSYVPIIGYSYGKKKTSTRGNPQIYKELAGQEFWAELTGDDQFYLKLIQLMDRLPTTYVLDFQNAYMNATNRLVREFTVGFCNEVGEIDWEKLVVFNSGSDKKG